MGRLYFDLKLTDEFGRVHGNVRCEVPEDAAYMGDRIGGEMSLGLVPSFDAAVSVLRVKTLRRPLLISTAEQAARMLADHLEDREGWHGERRQERIEAQYKFPVQQKG